MTAPMTIHGIENRETMKKARAWLDERGVAHALNDHETAKRPELALDDAVIAGFRPAIHGQAPRAGCFAGGKAA